MSRTSAVGFAIAAASLAVCCARPQRDTRIYPIEPATLTIVTAPADLRALYVRDSSASVRYCAEPPPDVALSDSSAFSFSLPAELGQLSPDASAALAVAVTALAGRTQAVLLGREMLYRACELLLNDDVSPDSAISMYMRVAEMIESIAWETKAQAQASLLRAATEANRVGLDVDVLLEGFRSPPREPDPEDGKIGGSG